MSETLRPAPDQGTKDQYLLGDKEILLFLAGKVPQEVIAGMFGRSQSTISRRIRASGNGAAIPRAPSQRGRRLEEKRPAIASLAEKGVPSQKIADWIELPQRTVSEEVSRLRRAGELPQTPRSRGGRRTAKDLATLEEAIITGIQEYGKTHAKLAEEQSTTRVRITQIVSKLRSENRL